MGQQGSNVITVLFNTRDKTFLGRGGKWQSVNEFVQNPPVQGRDVAKTPQSQGDGRTDPGGGFMCEGGILYWCEENPGTGGFDKFDCGPCPW